MLFTIWMNDSWSIIPMNLVIPVPMMTAIRIYNGRPVFPV
jgi:hypothetical protein